MGVQVRVQVFQPPACSTGVQPACSSENERVQVGVQPRAAFRRAAVQFPHSLEWELRAPVPGSSK